MFSLLRVHLARLYSLVDNRFVAVQLKNFTFALMRFNLTCAQFACALLLALLAGALIGVLLSSLVFFERRQSEPWHSTVEHHWNGAIIVLRNVQVNVNGGSVHIDAFSNSNSISNSTDALAYESYGKDGLWHRHSIEVRWTDRIVTESVHANDDVPRVVPLLSELFALPPLHFVDNLFHLFNDNVFPLLMAMWRWHDVVETSDSDVVVWPLGSANDGDDKDRFVASSLTRETHASRVFGGAFQLLEERSVRVRSLVWIRAERLKLFYAANVDAHELFDGPLRGAARWRTSAMPRLYASLVRADHDERALVVLGVRRKGRHVVNRRVIVDAARLECAGGVRELSFDGGAIDDHVRALRSARVFVGIHGANLANALFLRANATLVQLVPSCDSNRGSSSRYELYRQLAARMQLRYVEVPLRCRGGDDVNRIDASSISVKRWRALIKSAVY
jgi:Glycosyltransferase 61